MKKYILILKIQRYIFNIKIYLDRIVRTLKHLCGNLKNKIPKSPLHCLISMRFRKGQNRNIDVFFNVVFNENSPFSFFLQPCSIYPTRRSKGKKAKSFVIISLLLIQSTKRYGFFVSPCRLCCARSKYWSKMLKICLL